jgi:hypothetical protein
LIGASYPPTCFQFFTVPDKICRKSKIESSWMGFEGCTRIPTTSVATGICTNFVERLSRNARIFPPNTCRELCAISALPSTRAAIPLVGAEGATVNEVSAWLLCYHSVRRYVHTAMLGETSIRTIFAFVCQSFLKRLKESRQTTPSPGSFPILLFGMAASLFYRGERLKRTRSCQPVLSKQCNIGNLQPHMRWGISCSMARAAFDFPPGRGSTS